MVLHRTEAERRLLPSRHVRVIGNVWQREYLVQCRVSSYHSERRRTTYLEEFHRLICRRGYNLHAASTPADQICPVCYDSVTNPLVLARKHVYCMPCVRHFLANAEETDEFALMCVGEEGRCGVPVPIPIVQRFSAPADFARLLEVAFTSFPAGKLRSDPAGRARIYLGLSFVDVGLVWWSLAEK